MKSLSAINDVGEVEVNNVVACDDIRVDFKYEISPSLQQSLLRGEGINLASHYGRTGIEGEYISDQRFGISMDLDDVGDLNDWVRLRLGETPLVC